MNTELQHVRSDRIVKLSATIAIQAHRPLHACELHAEKAVNSNRVKRCCLIGCDQDLSVESCNTHYFQGRHRVKNSFQSGKVHISQVCYPEESIMPRSNMRDSTSYGLYYLKKKEVNLPLL